MPREHCPLPTPYFDSGDGRFVLHHADCLDILPCLADVDMIFADPPYFLSGGGITCHAGRMVTVDKGEWDRPPGLKEMHRFNREWLQACQKALKNDGTIWVSGTQHVIYSIGLAMQELGFKLLNSVTWFKPNASPNLSCRYFTHSTETIIWAARSEKSKHYFDYQRMKQEANGKQMRDLWVLPTPPRREKLHGKHPTQKPLALLERIVLAGSREGDCIVDPFTGSSTTGIAAVALGRRFVGIDAEDGYLALSVKRYRAVVRQKDLFQELSAT